MGVFQRCQSELPKKDLKQKFLAVLFGSADCDIENEPCKILKQFKYEVSGIAQRLSKNVDYAELFTLINEDPTKTNKLGSFMSYVYQRQEHELLMSFSKFLTQKKYIVGTLIFDGLLVEREPDEIGTIELDIEFPLVLIEEAEKYILSENELFSYYKIKINIINFCCQNELKTTYFLFINI